MTADKPRPEPMQRDKVLILATALAGAFLVNVSGQAFGTGIVDIQGGIGVSADEASWLTTVFTMAQLAGIVCAVPLIGTFGLRRAMTAAGLTFGLSALAAANIAELEPIIALRALQGFAAGSFGPMAFLGTFTTTGGGPRLPFGLSLLALALLLPVGFGLAASGILLEAFGWLGLFLVQSAIGAAIAIAAILFMPQTPVNLDALRRDWAALSFLAAALASSLLVFGQGTRLYWLDSPWILWSMAFAAGAWTGFLFTLWRSPMPVLDLALVKRRSFIIPVILNLLFRTGSAGIIYLVPQFLIITQAYRPLELSQLYLWVGVPQLLVFPLTWWLLQRLDGRLVMAAGMLLFGCGALLASGVTNQAAAEQFRLTLALSGAAQILLLAPTIIAGAGPLKATEGPTASLLFNATTVGGTSLGIAMATELVTERQKFHVGALAESGAAYGKKLEIFDQLAVAIASRTSDDMLASARAIASTAAALRREAWVLAFNDGFLLVGAFLVASTAALLLLTRQTPLRNTHPISARASS